MFQVHIIIPYKRNPLDFVTEMKFPQVILGTMVHLWSVANPWWMPSLRVLPGSSAVPATLLELYRKWLPSQVGEAFSKPKRKGSTMPSQQRVKSIKATADSKKYKDSKK